MTRADQIQLLVDFFREVKCTFKVKLTNETQKGDWDYLFIRPAESYVEFGRTGPVRISEVEWIDINPIENVRIGARVPDKQIDHTKNIKNYLDKNLIHCSVQDKIIRISFADTKS